MKSLLLVLTACLLSTIITGQDQAMAAQMIEEDYTYLLKGIADINAELVEVSDRDIRKELATAKSALIEDYISGPFAIFESRKSVVKLSGRSTTIESYLKSLSHRNSSNIDISITDMQTSNNVIYVSYHLKGITGKTLKLKSKVINKGSDLYIASIANIGSSVTPNVAKNTTTKRTEDYTIPEIITRVTTLLDDQIIVQGEIKNHQKQGTLSIRTKDYYSQGVELKSNGTFSFSLAQSDVPVQDIVMKYQYGDKFMEMRKNLIVTEDSRLLSGLQPVGSSTDNSVVTGGHE